MDEQGGRIGNMRFWGGGLSLISDVLRELRKKYPIDGTGHAMMLETSRILATHPHLVDLSRVKHIMNHPLDSQIKIKSQEECDFIAAANAEDGNVQLDAMAQRAAKIAVDLLAEANKETADMTSIP